MEIMQKQRFELPDNCIVLLGCFAIVVIFCSSEQRLLQDTRRSPLFFLTRMFYSSLTFWRT
ncbi:MAG: hypothetical protein QG646_4054 [Euryarchaeota archaeon]|nr:hypothetical protein [Euryarchaeota archaeon]